MQHINNSPEHQVISSLLIYISQYYPLTQQLLIKIIHKAIDHFPNHLFNSLTQLTNMLIQQLVYGPSHSNQPIASIPIHSHQDMHFMRTATHQSKDFNQAFNNLNLNDIINPSQLKQLQWYHPNTFMKLACQIQTKSEVIKQLSLEGQSWLEVTPLSSVFLIVRKAIEYIVSRMGQNITIQIHLMRARLAFMHNKILQNPVKQLSEVTLGSYRKCLSLMHQSSSERQIYISTMLQYSYSLLFYYKYSASIKAIQMCQQGANLQIQYTGILGRRTKYQSFDTPQLVMNLTENNQQVSTQQPDQPNVDQKVDLPDPKQLILKEKINSQNKISSISTVKYDEESILLDAPKFLTEIQNLKIDHIKALVVLASIHHAWVTVPKDQLSYQQISTSVDTILLQSNLLYPIKFSLLLLRSLNEFPRVKHVERALEQLQVLHDQYRQQILKNQGIFPTPYQPFLSFIKVRADKLMEVGLTMSAIQLFEKVGMLEECVDGLIKRNYKQKALSMASKLIQQKGQTPRLLCMIGDAQKDGVEYYQKAWKLSGEKYPRAQKSLGWVYYANKQYAKAVIAFSKALQISYYQPSTWFTLGCAYIQLGQYQNALRPFSESISIDDTQGQAWGNMASCYIYLNKTKQAYSTLEQAVKHSNRNWKIWSNLLMISLKVKQFYKYFDCIETLVNLDHSQVLTDEVFHKVNKILEYKIETSQRKIGIFYYQKRIKKLYQSIEPKIGQLPIFWKHLTNFHITMVSYYQHLYNHYQKGRDPNDIVPGFEDDQLSKINYETSVSLTKKGIVQAKQSELNMTMAIGWQQNKLMATKVQVVLNEYISIYKQFSDKSDINEFQLFIHGVKSKITKCMSD